MTQQEVERFQ